MQFLSLVHRTTQNLSNASKMQMQMQNLTTNEPVQRRLILPKLSLSAAILCWPKCQNLPKHFGTYRNRNFRPKAEIFSFRLNSVDASHDEVIDHNIKIPTTKLKKDIVHRKGNKFLNDRIKFMYHFPLSTLWREDNQYIQTSFIFPTRNYVEIS